MKYRICDVLEYGVAKLQNKDRPRLEAELLLAYVLKQERIYLHMHCEEHLSEEEFAFFSHLLIRLENEEPIEYLIGKVGFYGYEWEITSGVLIPRPETEILVEKVDHWIKTHHLVRVFELGIGSGVISITLALLNPSIQIVASDISPQALWVAQKNIEKFSLIDSTLSQRISLIGDNIFQNETIFEKQFDFLVSNPPYIANAYPLPKNVLYEPKEALFGGDGGEEILYSLVDLSEKYKIPFLACEMGYDQKNKMQTKLKNFTEVHFYQDLSGLDRGFIAKKARISPIPNSRLESYKEN